MKRPEAQARFRLLPRKRAALLILTAATLLQSSVLFAGETPVEVASDSDGRGSFLSASSGLRYGERRPFRRFHAAVSLGTSWIRPGVLAEDTRYVRSPWNQTVRLTAGMDISPHLGAELHLAGLREAALEDGGRLSYSAAGASALWHFGKRPVLESRVGYSAFVRLGYGRTTQHLIGCCEHELSELLVGGGFEAGFRNGLALRAEMLRYNAETRLYELALLYRFARPRGRPPLLGVASDKPVLSVSGNKAVRAPGMSVPPQASNAPNSSATVAADAVQSETPIVAPMLASSTTAMRLQHVSLQALAEASGESGDADGDGVLDRFDRCDDTPQGVQVTAHGCHSYAGQQIELRFDIGSAELDAKDLRALDRLARALMAQPARVAHLAAYTDDWGQERENRRLAGRRADAVARVLQAQGVSADQLRVQLIGSKAPIISNATKAGRAANRRVVVVVAPG